MLKEKKQPPIVSKFTPLCCIILIQLTWCKGFRNLCIQRISSERDFKLGSLYHLAADHLPMVFTVMLIINGDSEEDLFKSDKEHGYQKFDDIKYLPRCLNCLLGWVTLLEAGKWEEKNLIPKVPLLIMTNKEGDINIDWLIILMKQEGRRDIYRFANSCQDCPSVIQYLYLGSL